ncbi:LAGLIDADG family homing endonuclease, partial [Clostridiaceae bacterium HSG29]|nr:LAGLIDADG family homing endonuclease [Clostridiaceae bacterium HSG29]
DLINLKFSKKTLKDRGFPETYDDWDISEKYSFLQGCFSANGSVINKYRISYKTISIEFAKKLLETLKEDFDINCYITTNKAKINKFSNGSYLCKESYDINISEYASILKFSENIGFYHTYKKISLKELLLFKSPKVVKIENNGVEKVYDFTEPETHWGIIEGFVVHNCAEYLAGTVFDGDLPASEYGGACNLGSLFLHKFVKNPFTNNSELDYDLLKKAIYVGVRFLDNIIDINNFPDQIYENYQKSFRTIGLGLTGLSDMLVMLNMQYDEKDAILFVDNLMDFISFNAFTCSIELAKEKGDFKLLNREEYVKSGFITKNINNNKKWNSVKEGILQYGIRNSKIMSIAPTGTLSLTFGENCSSGLEPIFSLEYDRKVKMGGQSEEDIKIVKMRDYAYGEWLKIKNTKECIVGIEKFKTAMELSVKAHVDMLSTIAFHVDMSCSKTINLPSEYSFEDTKAVYYDCWEKGIKGCTVFRPNPIRSGILISENEKKVEEIAIPRGFIEEVSDNLIGRKVKLQTGCGSLHVSLFFDSFDGEPKEIYLSKGSEGGCVSNLTALSRMISLAFRGGIPIEGVVDQLASALTCPSYTVRRITKKDTSRGDCCGTAIGNAIMDMYEEIKKELGQEESYKFEKIEEEFEDKDRTTSTFIKEDKYRCPECGSELINEGGCVQCRECGWSKCD